MTYQKSFFRFIYTDLIREYSEVTIKERYELKTFIDFIYTLLVGAAVVLFVSLGVWSFYPGPKMPDYPTYQSYPVTTDAVAQQNYEEESRKAQEEYDKKFKEYEKVNNTYGQKVAIISLSSAAVFYALGLWLMKRNDTVGEGLSLGGIFTAIYAAVRAGSGNSRPVVFAAVTAILAMAILLVVRRPSDSKK